MSENNLPFCHRNKKFGEPRRFGLAWKLWANEMKKTHVKVRCPKCRKYHIWKLKMEGK